MMNKVLGMVIWQVISLSTVTTSAAKQPAGKPRARVVNYAPEAATFEVEVEERLNNHERRLGHLEKVAETPVAARAKPAPTRSRPAAPAPESKKTVAATHTVKSGETPSSIARHHGISVAELMKANHLAAAATLHPGQKLRLPGAGSPAAEPAVRGRYGYEAPGGKSGTRYTVKPGDTVSSLARRSGVSEQDLMRLNALKDPTKLRVGSLLRLPSGGTVATEAPEPNETASRVVEPQKPLPDGWCWHHVKQGESLSQIAGHYKTDRRAIERENDLTGGSAALREGMELKIPPPEVASADRTAPVTRLQTRRWAADEDESVLGYTVQKGDSVDGLAEDFKTSASILRRLNRLGTTEGLVAGRRIVVPNTIFE